MTYKYKCFITEHQQALLVIMLFTLSFAGSTQRGDYANLSTQLRILILASTQAFIVIVL